jgi:hypothetical protein
LKQYALPSPEEQVEGEMRRLEANGVRNDLILSRLNFLKKHIQAPASKDNFTEANGAHKQPIELFNQYIDHKNHQFYNIEDNALQQLMDSVSYYTNSSHSLLDTITPRNDAQRQTLTSYYQNLERFQNRVLEEKEFVAGIYAQIKIPAGNCSADGKMERPSEIAIPLPLIKYGQKVQQVIISEINQLPGMEYKEPVRQP